jgi:hypothetical protein
MAGGPDRRQERISSRRNRGRSRSEQPQLDGVIVIGHGQELEHLGFDDFRGLEPSGL